MSTAETNLNGNSAINPIPQAIEEARIEVQEVTPSELAHLQRVYAEAEQADKNLQSAIAAQSACLGARNSFMVFLTGIYSLTDKDNIDLTTGKINRQS